MSVRYSLWKSIFLLACLIISACKPKATPSGWWWLDVTISSGGNSSLQAILPLEVASDGSLTAEGTFQGTLSLPAPCVTLKKVAINGTIGITGHYSASGEGGFILNKLHLAGSPEQETVCPGKDPTITRALVIMDVSQFTASLVQGWEKRANINAIGKKDQSSIPDISASNGASGTLQVAFSNVTLSLHDLTTLPDLDGRVVTVAVEKNYPPFNAVDPATGQDRGWDYDAISEICRRVNCSPSFKQANWETIFTDMQTAKYDWLANGVVETPEREALLDFSTPYIVIGESRLAFAFPPGSSLTVVVNLALQAMREDGSLDKVNTKWDLTHVNP
jgi:hypothetical protein